MSAAPLSLAIELGVVAGWFLSQAFDGVSWSLIAANAYLSIA
jgi:hypothetical protein